eukprot:GGOE01013906.1.p1 GENE.GGOE01013906.1~~GGOE01013906.1.p1  ORF type:complete len:597 (-),score=39.15 GGOE01013906.1:61-1815(-)
MDPTVKKTLTLSRRLISLGLLFLVGREFLKQKEGENRAVRRKSSTKPLPNLPSRTEIVNKLRLSSNEKEEFDIVVLGGGIIGGGIALDAASRGLSVCLLEEGDFGMGSSLEPTRVQGTFDVFFAALRHADLKQMGLVQDTFREQSLLSINCPHLSHTLPILIPIFRWVDMPKYYISLCFHHLLGRWSGFTSERPTRLAVSQAVETLPFLAPEKLKVALRYFENDYDGSRLGLSLSLTAAHWGACVVNHVKILEFCPEEKEQARRLKVQDSVNKGPIMELRTKVVVDTCGRQPGDQTPLVPSSGLQLSLPSSYCPQKTGLFHLTFAGSPLLMLPWMGRTIAGFSKLPTQDTTQTKASQLVNAVKQVMPSSPIPSDVCAVCVTQEVGGPAANSKGYAVVVDEAHKAVTVASEDWTLYRRVAEEAVNQAVHLAGLEDKAGCCVTPSMMLLGGHRYHSQLPDQLSEQFNLGKMDAQQLVARYGDRAPIVAQLISRTKFKELCSLESNGEQTKFWEAEVQYAVAEYACTPLDFLARRAGLALLDYAAAAKATPRVTELMGTNMGWSRAKLKQELEDTVAALEKFRPVQM